MPKQRLLVVVSYCYSRSIEQLACVMKNFVRFGVSIGSPENFC